uniref:Uncharacterized protein n=1 Tax=Leptobrachium leishanense TaxID=445787 RepID=A0A8C5MVV8_9ANUR
MSTDTHKHYHDEAFHPRNFVDTHFCGDSFPLADENQGFPIEQLHKEIEAGRLDGEMMFDISVGATAGHMIPTSRKFSKIYVVEFTDANICEFQKWLDKEPGSCSFSYGAKLACKLEGCSSESWEEKEDRVRQAVAGLVKWDIFEDNHMVPADLPHADAVLSVYALNAVSKTKEDFESNLEKLHSWLKVGGCLMLFSPINMTFYTIDDEKFFVLKVDENFVKQAVRKAGIAIEREIVLPSKKTCDLVDYDSVMCIIGRKE